MNRGFLVHVFQSCNLLSFQLCVHHCKSIRFYLFSGVWLCTKVCQDRNCRSSCGFSECRALLTWPSSSMHHFESHCCKCKWSNIQSYVEYAKLCLYWKLVGMQPLDKTWSCMVLGDFCGDKLPVILSQNNCWKTKSFYGLSHHEWFVRLSCCNGFLLLIHMRPGGHVSGN